MKEKIFLGFELETGKKIEIDLAHTVITGLTHLSGKTTALMTLLKNSGRKCIIFKTKIGEKALTEGTIIPPFFKDRSDWEFVISIIEATTKQKIIIEKGTIMKLSANTSSLLEILKKVQEERATGLKGFKEEIYIRLESYLQKVIPQVTYSNFSKSLTIFDGINIIDLEKFTEDVQALIITSVLDEVLANYRDIVVVVPECWKFAPEGKYETPVKLALKSFIRQGATNGNYLFLDSQDIAGTSKEVLKQVYNWILGLQRERNEIKHTLDQLPIPKKSKPSEDEIANLKIGHFFVTVGDKVIKTYAQPTWMDSKTAKEIALGKKDVTKVKEPLKITGYEIKGVEREKETVSSQIIMSEFNMTLQKELAELRTDFFSKTMILDERINKIGMKLAESEQYKPIINEDVIVSKILQKIPMGSPSTPNFDMDSIINQVIARIPKTSGAVIYEVAPLDKLKKDFLEEAKQKILNDIQNLSNDAKKTLKYLESRGVGVATSEIVTKGFLLSAGGGNQDRINKSVKELSTIEVARKDAGGKNFGNLKDRIKNLLSIHGGTDQEIEQVYQHVLMEMLK